MFVFRYYPLASVFPDERHPGILAPSIVRGPEAHDATCAFIAAEIERKLLEAVS